MRKISFNLLIIVLAIVHAIAFYLNYGNYAFGLFSMISYLFVNYLYLKKQSNYSIISFEFFFFISFFLSCIVFPVLPLEETELYWVSKIFGEIQDGAKWRFLNLSLIGYYVYMLGLVLPKVQTINRNRIKEIYISNSFLTVSNILTLLLILYFFYSGGMLLMNRYSGDDSGFEKYGGILSYITMMYTISSAVVAIKWGQSSSQSLSLLFSKNALFVFNSILILPILLLSGYRSQFLQLFIPLLYLYVFFINKVSNKKMFLLFAMGFVLMMLIGITRGGDKASGGHDIAYYIRDFIIEDAAGIWLVDYTDAKGPTGGSNAILQMVSFIPFMGGFVESIIGAQNIALPSSRMFTYEYDTSGGGLGTNIIGDLYYTFGFVGVIFFMFLLGYLIRKLSYHGGIYSLVFYLLLIGNSVFATRVEYFYMVRTIGFSLIIVFLITLIAGRPQYTKGVTGLTAYYK